MLRWRARGGMRRRPHQESARARSAAPGAPPDGGRGPEGGVGFIFFWGRPAGSREGSQCARAAREGGEYVLSLRFFLSIGSFAFFFRGSFTRLSIGRGLPPLIYSIGH